MSKAKLTKRDMEILRTMMRVQLVKTRSLQWVFFPNMGVTRRRLRALRDYGLIVTHARGLPGKLADGGQYWRLSSRGLDEVLTTYKDEHEPDNLIARTNRASLRCFEHRDEMTDTYLRLIYSQDQDCDEIVSRADTLNWLGEYQVEIGYTEMGAGSQCRIVPDATLQTMGRRIFIEVDRSTESHARCKRTMNRYASSIRYGHYVKRFSDNLPVTVLYTTMSQRRAQGLQGLMNGFSQLPYEGLAMTTREASEWLRDKVCSLLPGALHQEAPHRDRRELDVACLLLRRVYEAYQPMVADEMVKGGRTAPPKELVDAYEYLQKRESEAVQ